LNNRILHAGIGSHAIYSHRNKEVIEMRMTIIDPFRNWDPFVEMQRTMEQFLGPNRPAYPPVELVDQTDKTIIYAVLPGIDKDTIELTILGDNLTIAGEKKLPAEGINYIRNERPHGKFRRQIALPYSVKQENVSASYKDGILTIGLPKAEEEKPRNITVE